jgi:glycosyltransferase involved in cell wall biosynthesis
MITLITPVYNGQKYLERTLNSLLMQEGTFDLEYIIVDGQSTDDTLEIIERFRPHLEKLTRNRFQLISEPDQGMYDALSKGFTLAKGTISGYINADDILLPGCLHTINRVFTEFSEIDWLTGKPLTIDTRGTQRYSILPSFYHRGLIQSGYYGNQLPFIQQESTFWRSSLIDTVNMEVFKSLKYAGDFFMWKSFSTKAELWQLPVNIAAARIHGERLSNNGTAYWDEMKQLASTPKWFYPALALWNRVTTYGLSDGLKKKWFGRVLRFPLKEG